jgi:hypothetical protein
MVVYRRHCDTPPTDGMTLLAIASHLASMKVRMAIRALLSNAGKHKLGVALPAVQSHMHSAKRKTGL